MHLKDYYVILEVETSATLPEIKQAYRRLAKKYHPDKNNNDPYSSAQFTEIKEAYEVLTHPGRKEKYLQQKWYNQSIGNRKKQDVITPVNVLKQVLELDRYVSMLDIHRMDRQGLTDYILEIISDHSITQLKTFNEPNICEQIIMLLVKQASLLTNEQAEKVSMQLQKLSTNEETSLYIRSTMLQYRKKRQLERYQPYIIATAALVICLLIWLLSR